MSYAYRIASLIESRVANNGLYKPDARVWISLFISDLSLFLTNVIFWTC